MATAFLSRVPGALFFVYLASLPLFMAGLALGPKAGMISSAVGFMAVGLVGGSLSAGVFGLMQALPAWMIVRQMLLQRPAGVGPGSESGQRAVIEWYPPGDMLCWLTMLAAGMLVFMAVAAAGVASWTGGHTTHVMDYDRYGTMDGWHGVGYCSACRHGWLL